jgi:fucose 4-O-acetylase-like acetyltransferase
MQGQVQNKTFSIVKAIGIILIVIGHSAIYLPICTFVYLIHIVIFFFVAGYFFNDKYLEKPLLFIKKKVIRFYVPWVVYGVIFVLLHNTFLNLQLLTFDSHTRTAIEPYDLSETINKIIGVLTFFKWKEPLLAPLWFLFGIFSGLCVFYAVSLIAKKIGKNKFEAYRAILIAICMAVGFAGGAYQWHISIIYRPLLISGLIYIGKVYSIYKDKIKLSPIIATICFAGLCIATALNYQINVGGMVFGNPLIFLIISFSGCYMILTLAHFINNKFKPLSDILDFIGNYTFSIMVLHYVAFKIAALIQICICNYPIKYLAYYPVIPHNTAYWWVLYTLIGVGIPLLFSYTFVVVKNRIREQYLEVEKM